MTKQEAFRLIGEIDGRYVESAEDCAPRKWKNRKRNMRMLAAAAACLVLAAGILAGVMRYDRAARQIPLDRSSDGVTARYVERLSPAVSSGEHSLIGLSEDEIFTHWNTAIFRGTVTDVRNIVIDFAGQKMYRAIARVRVSSVVRGPFSEGDEAPVLLPYTVGGGSTAEDCGTIESIRVGMEGIFMPIVYDDENNFVEMNGVRLDKRDLAPCGLADGLRWAFLETSNRLIYDESSFPSLAGATSLDEVEAFLWKKAG
ncbi:MAG: hypothetical protein J6V24_06330 [Clostridia bacterium]|nr:hypothetical protein [Clostridia bacterium]